MPERNLVTAEPTDRASQISALFNLPKMTNRLVVVCSLSVAVVVFATQIGCSKIRSGGLDRNILRSGETIPSQPTQPAGTKARFSNDPSKALLELNDVYEEFEGKPFGETTSDSSELDESWESTNAASSQFNDARILEGSQQSFDTQERGIKLVAIQPPAPSIKDSFESGAQAGVSGSGFDNANSFSSANVDKVLLGGIPLSEIEPLNPYKIVKQCEHVECDCMKEKLKPELPFAQPVQPPAISSQVPPSELVSQPLAPIMFDEATREVEDYGTDDAKLNRLRLVQQHLVEHTVEVEEKVEAQPVAQTKLIAKTEDRPMQYFPTVDPELGRTVKTVASCRQCESPDCAGQCKNSNRRPDNNQLRPVVDSEKIPSFAPPQVVGTAIPAPPRRTPISIQGEFVAAPKVAPVAKVDYEEYTTEDWAEIFGPPKQTVRPRVAEMPKAIAMAPLQKKNRRLDFQPQHQISPPSVQVDRIAEENPFHPTESNDFSPIKQDNVELVVAEVATEGAKWEPPKHTNFSPIPTVDRRQPRFAGAASLALEKAALRGADTPFPVVDTRVEIPAKPEVIVEVVDNTVPWSVKLAETIDNVRRQRDAELDPMTRNGIEVNLRLLEVLQRQMTTVEENRHTMPNSERQYWQHQLDAITLMLPATNNGVSDLDRHSTAYETLEHLRKAVERLESLAELKVQSGRFCTEISGFGKYKPFASTVFAPGQKTLVYCEVENYTSSPRVINSDQNYLTRLRGSYVVYDEQGRVVQQSEYPVVDDVARKRRRDFYMYFPIQIGELAAGNYKLELMIEDLSSNKTAALKPGMQFQVR